MGTFGALCPDPEVLFPVPRNTKGPGGDGIFKSPDLNPEEEEQDLRSETTTLFLSCPLDKEEQKRENLKIKGEGKDEEPKQKKDKRFRD
ncbi:hypothetical protein NDU88_007029 [Pleurodeles waltl]|uniref:Uncharacterized protein n=1 Tax=Pleurodeles waltl TaxID=8319 RepID=A0AAV7UNQ4_PLEWA|nr:hypothetical protein NDU88_007029 [Pleurodeles waltl]